MAPASLKPWAFIMKKHREVPPCTQFIKEFLSKGPRYLSVRNIPEDENNIKHKYVNNFTYTKVLNYIQFIQISVRYTLIT